LADIVWGLCKDKPLLSMFGSFGFMLQSIIDILMVYQQQQTNKQTKKTVIFVDSMYFNLYLFIKNSLQLRV